ncbi:MAG TPA: hypothetical protein VFC42_09510 [Methylomirabilota bacterium]|nr:hypothetical protein [Methylomirabilota bacterium]
MATLTPPRIDRLAGPAVRAGAALTTAAGAFPFRYEVEGDEVASGPEPFVAASLLLCMRAGEPLRVPGRVSPRLLSGLERIEEIFHVWDRRLRPVPVEADPAVAPPPPGKRGVACFFSGGVDSFYSVLKHAGALSALVFCIGWDPARDAGGRWARALVAARAAAGELGLPLVTVETNLHPLRDRVVSWRLYHGAALASVALLLGARFRRVLIPASHSYADLYPLGSHPLVDPLWSTEATELVHDGCEATRAERAARVAASPVALRWLRVCAAGDGASLNCGRCEKCLRTMVALRAAGSLERCRTFGRPLDLDAVAALALDTVHLRAFAEDNLRAVEAGPGDPALAAALRAALGRAPAAVA